MLNSQISIKSTLMENAIKSYLDTLMKITIVSEMEQAEPGDQRKETNKSYVLVFHFYYLVINRNFIMCLAGATFLSEGFPGK